MLKKYPVISKSGNVYEVVLFFGSSIAYAGLNVDIKKETRTIFGLKKIKTVRFFNTGIPEDRVLRSIGYIDIVKRYVAIYENEIKEVRESVDRREVLTKEFEEWDGYC